ncbi:hypothetical protein [Saliphagus infecundisoli]|uniref:Uncharacterized protein n=1 Tax=Saliphagus infecundisoli TaxID=1849069 RepID=A0ABD5QFD5_9EURY|nr:hypothetical protein [Saliphagus infecundisoli]
MADRSIPRPNAYGTIALVCLVGSVVSAFLGAPLSVRGGFGALAVVTVAAAMYRSRSPRPSRDEDADSGDGDDDDEREGELEGQKGATGFS